MTWFTRHPIRPSAPTPQPARTVAERQAVLAAIDAEREHHRREHEGLEERAQRLASRVAEARQLLAEAEQLDAELLAASLQSDHRLAVLERPQGWHGYLDSASNSRD